MIGLFRSPPAPPPPKEPKRTPADLLSGAATYIRGQGQAGSGQGSSFLRPGQEIQRTVEDIQAEINAISGFREQVLNEQFSEMSPGRRRLLRAFNPGGLARADERDARLKLDIWERTQARINELRQEQRMVQAPNQIEVQYADEWLKSIGEAGKRIDDEQWRAQQIQRIEATGHPVTQGADWGYRRESWVATGDSKFLDPTALTDDTSSRARLISFVAENFHPDEIPNIHELSEDEQAIAMRQATRNIQERGEDKAEKRNDELSDVRREILSVARGLQESIPEVPVQTLVQETNVFGMYGDVVKTRWLHGKPIDQVIYTVAKFFYGLDDEQIQELFPGFEGGVPGLPSADLLPSQNPILIDPEAVGGPQASVKPGILDVIAAAAANAGGSSRTEIDAEIDAEFARRRGKGDNSGGSEDQ